MRCENWEIGGFDRDSAVTLCRAGLNPLVAVFLASRGITQPDAAYNFLNDDISLLHDPFLLSDMDKAAARINEAVRNGERIAVYGDYDVDGMTSCVLLADWLRSKSADYEIYIPGRLDEGYGLNNQALDALKTRGVSLVITVDCGITAIAEAEYAKSLGMSLIITDHHECRDELPGAVAVIDPKRPDCPYPNTHLAGVGVCFKLVCALEPGEEASEMLRRYGDLVAIGTVADVMPVIGENRVLIRRGIDKLNNEPRPGLRCLLKELFHDKKRVNSGIIGFALAPRLNAAGRMGVTDVSVRLLLSDNDSQAEELASELDRLNTERRRIETETFEEALAMLEGHERNGPVVLAGRGWHQGVMGIVAARIAERSFLPAVLISIGEDGVGRGSCRSFGDFGLYSALQGCGDILTSYGGHEMAAGITLAEENIEELKRRITEYYHENITLIPKPTLRLDLEVEKPELLSAQNVEALTVLEPFGNQNPGPFLYIGSARLISAVSVGGGKHSRLKLEKSGKTLDCIFFSTSAEELGVSKGMLVDVAFAPQINEFRGKSTVQLHVFDIRKSSGGLTSL